MLGYLVDNEQNMMNFEATVAKSLLLRLRADRFSAGMSINQSFRSYDFSFFSLLSDRCDRVAPLISNDTSPHPDEGTCHDNCCQEHQYAGPMKYSPKPCGRAFWYPIRRSCNLHTIKHGRDNGKDEEHGTIESSEEFTVLEWHVFIQPASEQ